MNKEILNKLKLIKSILDFHPTNSGCLKSTLFILSSIILLGTISCKENQNKIDIQYKVDTLIINSKERLLDLNGWILTSDLNSKETMFYLFNGSDLSIDEINLESKEFVKKIPLQAEGPNGVGDYIFNLQILNDSIFFTKSYNLSTLIWKNGTVFRRIGWEFKNDHKSRKLDDLPRKLELASIEKDIKAFGISYDYKNLNVYLDIYSEKDSTIKRINVDPENSFRDFFLQFDDNKNFIEPSIDLKLENNHILISHEFSNEVIVYNNKGEFSKVVKYEPKLTPKRASIPIGPKLKSREQIGLTYQRILEQCRFEPLVWDKLNKRYYRISSKRIFNKIKTNIRTLTPEVNEVRVFITIFDSEFKLLSELEIDELIDDRMKYFVKDGKLWVSQNFNDELGFLIFDIKLLI